ncbi:hypothetical protein BJX61DRAFT_511521 [Aspergillus egyptiacus]|nr:hypothetical protein BJX61DRAFT_511521 [Aspergillus egyptiacus]
MAMSEMTETESDMPLTPTTDSRGFLADLLNPTCPIPRYVYQGKEQFLKDFQHAPDPTQPYSEWLLLTHVTKEIFDADFLESEEYPFASVSSYNSQLEILLLRTVQSKPQGAAATEFVRLLDRATGRRGVQFRTYGGYHSAPAGDWGKCPDMAWRPVRLPQDRSPDWPSAVLEVSFAETGEKLRSDTRQWLGATRGDVKIVVTVAIERTAPRIVIEQWVGKDGSAGREQRIEITKKGDEIEVSAGALELSFERLFLHPFGSDRTPIISVHAPALKSYAEAIWEFQGFVDIPRM